MEELEKEVARAQAQSSRLKDKHRQLRANTEEERQKHATTRLKLENCETASEGGRREKS